MAKGTELSKGEITALKRVRKSQREILKALGRRKTIICNYLKSLNKYGIRKPAGRPEKLPQLKRRIVHEVKKDNFVNIIDIEISSGWSFQY